MTQDRIEPISDRVWGLVEEQVVPLAVEELVVGKRIVVGDTVRISTVTRSDDRLIEETLSHDRVEIEHVPVDRYVETAPPIREEGDVTIVPVLEEVLVRRLLLREEVHIRRVRTTDLYREVVAVRRQEVVVTRAAAGEPDRSDVERTSQTNITVQGKNP